MGGQTAAGTVTETSVGYVLTKLDRAETLGAERERARDRIERLNTYFETWRSGDEYDREAITHVMACAAHFPGAFLRDSRQTWS